MQIDLSGGAALITGATQGIGLSVAKHFAQQGCALHLWDKQSEICDLATELSQQYSIPVTGTCVDVASESEVSEAAERITQTGEASLKYVVHAAAIGSGCFGFPFTNLSPSDWIKPIQVNLMGMVHLAHAVTPLLRKQRSGSMVFIGSVAGQSGSQTDPPYSATKAANLNFTQCMAKDLAKDQIRVNMVCPGMVRTKLAESVWKSWYDKQLTDEVKDFDEWAEEKIKAMIPLGQWQTPEDIANMVLFLSSNLASQITGQIINVDGGYVMHW